MHGKVAGERAGRPATFNNPEPEGDIQSIAGFAVADVPFGDICVGAREGRRPRARGRDHRRPRQAPRQRLRGARRRRSSSAGRAASSSTRWARARASACATCSRCSRSTTTRATTASTRRSRRAPTCTSRSAAPEDTCGSGYIARRRQGPPDRRRPLRRALRAGRRRRVAALVRPRGAGIAGADVDVRSFVLDEGAAARRDARRGDGHGARLGVHPPRRRALGQRDGRGRPARRASTRSARFARAGRGQRLGVAHVTGNLDDFRPDAGLVARAELDVAGDARARRRAAVVAPRRAR